MVNSLTLTSKQKLRLKRRPGMRNCDPCERIFIEKNGPCDLCPRMKVRIGDLCVWGLADKKNSLHETHKGYICHHCLLEFKSHLVFVEKI